MKSFFFQVLLVACVAANDCIQCGEDELACFGPDPIGDPCPTCIPMNGGRCGLDSCPTVCYEGYQLCGTGIDSWNGCNIPGWCKQVMDSDTGCPLHCPVSCEYAKENHCQGQVDMSNGCIGPEYCVPLGQQCGASHVNSFT